ncbi:MAG: hypothetical protein WB973_10440 [Thermoanaerobaculia bacterium]
MTPENAYASLLKLLQLEKTASVVLAAGEEPLLRRVNVSDEVASEFHESAQRSFNEEVKLIEYDAGYTPDANEIVFISIAHERVKEIVTSIADAINIEPFKGEETIIDTMRFYAAVFGDGGAEAVFFRIKTENLNFKDH